MKLPLSNKQAFKGLYPTKRIRTNLPESFRNSKNIEGGSIMGDNKRLLFDHRFLGDMNIDGKHF